MLPREFLELQIALFIGPLPLFKHKGKDLTVRQKDAYHEWARGIYTVTQKFPQIQLISTDPTHYPMGKHNGRCIWRCTDHPYLAPTQAKQTGYISPVDNLPAYNTPAWDFLDKLKPDSMCCVYANNEYQRGNGWQLLNNLLTKRGKTYGTQYQILNIDNSDQYVGGKRNVEVTIYCELHDNTYTTTAERLIRHVAMPCEICRKDPSNHGKAPPLVAMNYKKHKGPAHTLFKNAALTKYGSTCLLTQTSYQSGRSASMNSQFYLEVHHLNAKEVYPSLQTQVVGNSVVLTSPIHRQFHYSFLRASCTLHDSITLTKSFTRVANLYTFILYLEQLVREVQTGSQNGFLAELQPKIKQTWVDALADGATTSPEPVLTEANLRSALVKLNSPEFKDVFMQHPESIIFMQACGITNF